MYFYKQNSRLGLNISDLRNENRNTSFPLDEYPEFPGYIRYKATEQPIIHKEEKLVEAEPILTKDGYVQVWVIEPLD